MHVSVTWWAWSSQPFIGESVQLGIAYTGHPTTGDWRIRYDNVTIDWQ